MTEATPLDDAFRQICAMEAPLAERLSMFTAAVNEHSNPVAQAYEALIAQISNAAAGATAPPLGAAMPPFLLPDHTGKLMDLADLLASGPVVLSFNRGHWCEYCELELRAYASAHAEFAARGARAVSIMPERGEYTRKVSALTNDSLTVLSDIDNGYALQVGIVMWLGDEVRALYRGFGLDIDSYQGNAAWFVPMPATFVLDRNGIVIGRKVDPDFRRRMDIDEILSALEGAA